MKAVISVSLCGSAQVETNQWTTVLYRPANLHLDVQTHLSDSNFCPHPQATHRRPEVGDRESPLLPAHSCPRRGLPHTGTRDMLVHLMRSSPRIRWIGLW